MNEEDRIRATGEAAVLAACMVQDLHGKITSGFVQANLTTRHIDIFFPYEVKPQKAHGIRKALKIEKITKQYKPHEGCDLLWRGRNDNFSVHFMFYKVCTIVAYEEKIIPATEEKIIPEQIIPAKAERVDKVPIWDCKEVEKEAVHAD